MAHYTEAFSDRIEAADHPFYIGQQMFTEHLSIRQARALLNPRECEYKLRMDDLTFIIKHSEKEGREILEDFGHDTICEAALDEIWWAFLESNEIELISCRPYVLKPKPLTCHMIEDNGGEPILCVVDCQGGTTFFAQDRVHNSAVLDRDTIQALTGPTDCQFIVGFGADEEELEDPGYIVNVDPYKPPEIAAEIAKGSYLYPKFSILRIRSA